MNDCFEPHHILVKAIDRLARPVPGFDDASMWCNPLPSVMELHEVMQLIREIVFPGFFDKRQIDPTMRSFSIGANVEALYSKLRIQAARGLLFGHTDRHMDDVDADATRLAIDFIDRLPDIKRVLYTDVRAIYDNDPAVGSFGDVIFCYPVMYAMIHYRVAHTLLEMGLPLIPRIITELAHSATGIDINPGARIGEYFAIDHGTGVVIGETCIIGNHVTLYQGVTLGAKNFVSGEDGRPVNVPRHPIIEDNVTIYANATVLGRITIGRDSVIGGNVWLTESVPAGSRIIQTPSKQKTNKLQTTNG